MRALLQKRGASEKFLEKAVALVSSSVQDIKTKFQYDTVKRRRVAFFGDCVLERKIDDIEEPLGRGLLNVDFDMKAIKEHYNE